MSHFVVWVDTEDPSLIDMLMAPFSENTQDLDYLEFQSVEEEQRQKYEALTVDCIRMSNGSIITAYDSFFRPYTIKNGVVYQKSSGRLHNEKRTKKAKKMTFLPDYPLKKVFRTYKDYMELYCGYIYDEAKDAYGYYTNPNSFYDWYEVGGRWPNMFLVQTDCESAIDSEGEWIMSTYAPDGYKWTAGAHKRDIAWDVMKRLGIQKHTLLFHTLEDCFKIGMTPENYSHARITEDGILNWQSYLYRKGETLEQYLERNNLGLDCQYPCSPYGFVHDAQYCSRGHMGWFGISTNEKDEKVWRDTVQRYLEELPEDTFLVSLDCHV